MAFQAAHQVTKLYVGPIRLSAYTRNIASDSTVNMIDVTVIDKTVNQGAKHFVPDDDTSTFSADGPLDNDNSANLNRDVLTDMKEASTPTPITYFPNGTSTIDAWLIEALATDLTIPANRGDSVNWTLAAQTTGQTDVNGQLLTTAAETAITADGNGTAIDGGASSSNGGVAHLHVTAFSGLTNDVITIEDSADGSTGWATILTFSTVTGVTSQRVAITGTVRRHLRVVDNVTGTGSITRTVAFSRR